MCALVLEVPLFWSRNCFSSGKGCVINDHVTEASNGIVRPLSPAEQVRTPSTPPPPRSPPPNPPPFFYGGYGADCIARAHIRNSGQQCSPCGGDIERSVHPQVWCMQDVPLQCRLDTAYFRYCASGIAWHNWNPLRISIPDIWLTMLTAMWRHRAKRSSLSMVYAINSVTFRSSYSEGLLIVPILERLFPV